MTSSPALRTESRLSPVETGGVCFVPADPPRVGQVLLWGSAMQDVGEPGSAVIVPPPGDTTHELAVRRLPVTEALPLLLVGGDDPARRFWAAAARLALHLVARGRLLPGVSPAGFDAWRVGPLDADDAARLRDLAAAMPPTARAVVDSGTASGTGPSELPAAALLLRAFLDAVADTLPRSPGAAMAVGTPLFAAPDPQAVAELRDWADEVAAGVDAGVRVSLRVETDADASRFRAVVQLHALADPTRVADLADVWTGAAVGFCQRARIDALLAVRRAARFWEPLQQLLRRAVPDELELDDGDVADLLGDAATRLTAGGIAVHWPRDLRPALSTRVVAGHGTGPATFGAEAEPLMLDWELALRGDPLTPEERDQLAHSHRPVVRLRDEWALLDPGTRQRAREQTLGPVTAVAALGAALTGEVDTTGGSVPVRATGWLQELRERIASPPAPAVPPDGLAAVLRDYQLRGLGWLDRMTSLGLGAPRRRHGPGQDDHAHRLAPATAGPRRRTHACRVPGVTDGELGT